MPNLSRALAGTLSAALIGGISAGCEPEATKAARQARHLVLADNCAGALKLLRKHINSGLRENGNAQADFAYCLLEAEADELESSGYVRNVGDAFKLATEHFKLAESMKGKPAKPEGYYNAAGFLLSMKDPVAARSAYEKAVQAKTPGLESQRRTAACRLAKLCLQQNDLRCARDHGPKCSDNPTKEISFKLPRVDILDARDLMRCFPDVKIPGEDEATRNVSETMLAGTDYDKAHLKYRRAAAYMGGFAVNTQVTVYYAALMASLRALIQDYAERSQRNGCADYARRLAKQNEVQSAAAPKAAWSYANETIRRAGPLKELFERQTAELQREHKRLLAEAQQGMGTPMALPQDLMKYARVLDTERPRGDKWSFNTLKQWFGKKPLNYKMIEKNPSAWIGKKGWFKGKIFNIVESDKHSTIQMHVCGRGYDCNLYVVGAFAQSTLLRGMWPMVFGYMAGSKTYTSTDGRTVTVPQMIVIEAATTSRR